MAGLGACSGGMAAQHSQAERLSWGELRALEVHTCLGGRIQVLWPLGLSVVAFPVCSVIPLPLILLVCVCVCVCVLRD